MKKIALRRSKLTATGSVGCGHGVDVYVHTAYNSEKQKEQPTVLLCVIAGSRFSSTPPRFGPAAPLTVPVRKEGDLQDGNMHAWKVRHEGELQPPWPSPSTAGRGPGALTKAEASTKMFPYSAMCFKITRAHQQKEPPTLRGVGLPDQASPQQKVRTCQKRHRSQR